VVPNPSRARIEGAAIGMSTLRLRSVHPRRSSAALRRLVDREHPGTAHRPVLLPTSDVRTSDVRSSGVLVRSVRRGTLRDLWT